MNIKSVEAERLTRELAALTGETMTLAVTVAVRERLERLHDTHVANGTAQRAQRLLALGRDIAPRLVEPWASEDHGGLLYDEVGLPT